MGGCWVCHNGAEDVKHMLFTCDRAREVWKGLDIWKKIAHLLGLDRSGSEILEEVIRRGVQVHATEVGLIELILTGGFVHLVGAAHIHEETFQRASRSAMSIAALTKNYKLATK